MKIHANLAQNIKQLEKKFQGCADFYGALLREDIYFCYLTSLVNCDQLSKERLCQMEQQFENADQTQGCLITQTNDLAFCISQILTGHVLMMKNNNDHGLLMEAKTRFMREIKESQNELSFFSSKDSFMEDLRVNVSLIRNRIVSNDLKIVKKSIGTAVETPLNLCYLESKINPRILKKVLADLDKLELPYLLDIGELQQAMEDNPFSPFPQMMTSERPDKASRAILEGKFVLLCEHSPFALIFPCTISDFYKVSDDYSERFQIVSFIRIIRYMAGFIAMALPGLFIAIVSFHSSVLPMELALNIAQGRQFIPFPSLVEVLIMELAFELLREAGLRLPSAIGATIGIVGGVIIGQAVVEAGIISPFVVVIVSLTGIASFAVPSLSLVSAFRLVKYFIIFCSACFGLYGFFISLILIFNHLINVRSFGELYLYPFVDGSEKKYKDWKDSLFRYPSYLPKLLTKKRK